MIDFRQLDAAIDLWLCMWQPEEQECFETALVRSMTDAHPRPTRLMSLATCHVLGTPRLLAAAARMAESQVFRADDVAFIEEHTLERHKLLQTALRMRGNVLGVELLLARFVGNAQDHSADALLDWVDVRDLVAVARTTVDARLFGEVERRIARRGKYQRGRAANVLGFVLRSGNWGSQSPEIGELGKAAG